MARGHQPLASAPPKSYDGHAATQYKSHSPPTYRGPQTAAFDSPSKPVNEDALPAMPTWEQASKKKVETIEMEDVEMEKLDGRPQDPRSASAPMLVNAAGAPMRSPHSPPRSLHSALPRSPYDPPARSPLRSPANEGYGYAPPQQTPFLGVLPSPGSYHSGQETGVAGGIDRRQHGTASPAPYPGYNNMPYGDDQYTGYSGTTYAPSTSTRYEPSMNDPYQHSQGQAQSPQGWQDQRLGRKPVQGSWRDI
ncbi:hypothetical protein H2201_005759 [Coniosporium apollinis]|uniref:Uncharacterized protein n=2 Tax=Coniosporium TaxID=2810619 RepID=A0ABQ9NS53_9PEZI|nr:hypothetical protein H2201_005759 [Coniosporium apollinis]